MQVKMTKVLGRAGMEREKERGGWGWDGATVAVEHTARYSTDIPSQQTPL